MFVAIGRLSRTLDIVLWIYKAIGLTFKSSLARYSTGVSYFCLIHLLNWTLLIHGVASIAVILIIAAIPSIGPCLNGLPTGICQP